MTNENKISESIFDGKYIVIPMADVHHIEKTFQSCDLVDGRKKGDLSGGLVIMKNTKYNFEHDFWENPINLSLPEYKKFIKAWTEYRHEIDGPFISPVE